MNSVNCPYCNQIVTYDISIVNCGCMAKTAMIGGEYILIDVYHNNEKYDVLYSSYYKSIMLRKHHIFGVEMILEANSVEFKDITPKFINNLFKSLAIY